MRRIFAVILCMMLLCVTVHAENSAPSFSCTADVSPTGSCHVAISATIYLEEPVTGLTFPLGTDVTGATLNGTTAATTMVGDITHVKLSHLDNQVGSFAVELGYTVENVIEVDDKGHQSVRVPLLAGFKYPVEKLNFSVTLPGPFEDSPEFFSGYHEQDIEKNMTVSVSGNSVIGSTNTVLKDSETLFMRMDAPEGMFTLAAAAGETLVYDHLGMGVFAALALLYWLFTMRRRPCWPGRTPHPPTGINAGRVGSYLVHTDADLTLMVLHWAQMGYLEIRLDRRDRVFLIKKMDMGNERSALESRTFKALFGRKTRVEATSDTYSQLKKKTAAASRHLSSGLKPHSGNPTIFRLLSSMAGIFAGIAMGDCILSPSTVTRWGWMAAMAVFTSYACWRIQRGMFCLYLQNRQDLKVSLLFSILLLIASSLCGAFPYGAAAVVWALFTGLLAAYGGRRTESGRQIFVEILGLRRFLRSVSPNELDRILRSRPDYYYELAPFALALGLDTRFASRFGSAQLSSCKWLLLDLPAPKNPGEWAPILHHTADLMDRGTARPFWKALLGLH